MAVANVNEISFMRKIFESCHALELPIVTSIIALTLMHRCVAFTGYQNVIFQNETIAISTVIFLSCKVDENTRILREVISAVRKLQNLTNSDWMEEDKVIKSLKIEVIMHEQYILRAIKFKTHVDVPHKYLLNFSRTLSLDSRPVSIAWGILNDSYIYCQTLAYEPPTLSCACLHIGIECHQRMSSTSSSSGVGPQLPTQWWTLLGIESDGFWSCVNYLIDLQYGVIIGLPQERSEEGEQRNDHEDGVRRIEEAKDRNFVVR